MTLVLDRANKYKKFEHDENSEQLEVIEIWPSNTSHELRTMKIPDVDVEVWSTKTSLDRTEAPALLRLVWVPVNASSSACKFDIQKSSLGTILKNFNLEEAFDYSFIIPGNFACISERQTEHPNTLDFSLSMSSNFGLVWKQDIRNGRTDGVCWLVNWEFQQVCEDISRLKEWAQHPLFLALVASVMLGRFLDNDLQRENYTILSVENRTRYHGFISPIVGMAQGDYTSLSRIMSGCAGVLAMVERDHKIMNEFIGDISLYCQRYDIRDDPRSRSVRLEVEDYIETLKRRLKMQKVSLDYLSRRVEIQLTAVSNTIHSTTTYITSLNGRC